LVISCYEDQNGEKNEPQSQRSCHNETIATGERHLGDDRQTTDSHGSEQEGGHSPQNGGGDGSDGGGELGEDSGDD
jgi:hypothetical protein